MTHILNLKTAFKLKPLALIISIAMSPFAAAESALAEDVVVAGAKPITTEQLNNEQLNTEQSSLNLAEITELPVITVTGTKRSQKLQEAVQSVTIFEEKDAIGLQYGFDVFKYIPNITVRSSSFLPTVRGLDGNGIATGGGGAVSGASSRMSNYIDGVARTFSATPDGQGGLWDIDQIEVYKGSQSTQLGRNSIAGAIVQTTNDPKFKDEYAVQVGMHDKDFTYNTAIMANKKINDQVAVRLTAETAGGKNYIDYSDFQGSGLSAFDRDDLGKTEFGRYRFKALLAPTSIPDLIIKFTLDNERNINSYPSDYAEASSGSSRKLISVGNYSRYESSNNVNALSATYIFNNAWSLDSILSYQRTKTNFGPPVVGSPDPIDYLNFTFNVKETTFEPKLSYKSTVSRTNAILGAFYLTRSRTDFGAPGSSFALTATDKSTTSSLFTDVAIEISDDWDLLLGGRLQRDQQKRDFSAFGGVLALDFDKKNNVFLPKIGATYRVTPDASVSLLTYKGYTASGGGLSFTTFVPYSFDKETAQTTELVTRTQWLDNKLTANTNLFYTRLTDAQISAIGPAGPTDQIYLNLEKANTYGAEFELSYAPTKKAKAFFSLGLLTTKIEEFGTAVNNIYNGNELALSPKATARLGGYAEVYPNLTVGGDVSYTSKRFSDYQNTDTDELNSSAIANINARFRLKNTTITGYVNNLFDKFVPTTISTAFDNANVNAPRTVGINVKLDF